MNYKELRAKHQEELKTIPILWAFSQKQLIEGLEKWGISAAEISPIGSGGFVKASDAEAFVEMFVRHANELFAAAEDKAFLTDALEYELANHEYCITHDPTDALAIFGLKPDSLTDMQQEALHDAKLAYFAGIQAPEPEGK